MSYSAERLYKDYVIAILLLKRFHMTYEEPLSLGWFRIHVSKPVLLRLLKEDMCVIHDNYYWDDLLEKNEDGISISFKGLWKAFKEAPPK